jgi:hypothetical protein
MGVGRPDGGRVPALAYRPIMFGSEIDRRNPLTGGWCGWMMPVSRRATAAMQPPRSRKVSRRFAFFSLPARFAPQPVGFLQ